ncbi:hypothetical protein EIN_031220 [Entamoeba invadens IP1]|uniref:DH domain-containing protein n=1 Tax=Entamoeba invadens IP1 TaxID=370355 RepID=A0A0A1U407_ENTIV|nr:hypothetical protein EIN_031220 [Entamoeba invadens IP1]ELP86421.1 hypothetical protein EIN_031220 [Entamoeba invadens IP1]|eukprot:XP_004185767.1 hypothetical protein EIN_031220 [Entamoeba invadens IP1]
MSAIYNLPQKSATSVAPLPKPPKQKVVPSTPVVLSKSQDTKPIQKTPSIPSTPQRPEPQPIPTKKTPLQKSEPIKNSLHSSQSLKPQQSQKDQPIAPLPSLPPGVKPRTQPAPPPPKILPQLPIHRATKPEQKPAEIKPKPIPFSQRKYSDVPTAASKSFDIDLPTTPTKVDTQETHDKPVKKSESPENVKISKIKKVKSIQLSSSSSKVSSREFPDPISPKSDNSENGIKGQSPTPAHSSLNMTKYISQQQRASVGSTSGMYSPKTPNSRSEKHQQSMKEASEIKGSSFFKKTSTPRMASFESVSPHSDSLEENSKNDKENKNEKMSMSARGCELEETPKAPEIAQNDFLRKYESFITDDDPETKIKFVPKNRDGKKITGSDIMMHTAELVFTEFMFCARLQIFQKHFEVYIRNEMALLKHQDYLLFEPLDGLVGSISGMCLELEPLYYELLDFGEETTKKKGDEKNPTKESTEKLEEVVLSVVLKYYSFVNGLGTINLSNTFLPFVAHYTSLSSTINDFIEGTNKLRKMVNARLENCIDQNIRQFADLYFAPTQRICRYELLLSTILKDVQKESKLHKVLSATIVSYKDMNTSINELIFKSKFFYVKRYEYLDQIYKSNKPVIATNTVYKYFTTPDRFVAYHAGTKGAAIGNNKIDLFIFKDGILRNDVKKTVFEFYPIGTIFHELSKKEENSLSENDIFFYDEKKKKSQIITLENQSQRDQFNYSLRLTYDEYTKAQRVV